MYGTHVLPKDTKILANELQHVLHCVGKIYNISYISLRSTILYARKIIRWVNGLDTKKIGTKDFSSQD